MTRLSAERRAALDALLADPPSVHDLSEGTGAIFGVWRTDRECYELLAERTAEGSHTLETGIGLSTALFARLGASHVCVTTHQEEAERLAAYLTRLGISGDRLQVVIGFSDAVLPTLTLAPLDVYFIDGGHGFPTPVIDWFYGASHLRRGGLLMIDDLQLPAVRLLVSYLDLDARWITVARTAKWAAYERASEGPIHEDHWAQPFVPHDWGQPSGMLERAASRMRHLAHRSSAPWRRA